MIFTLFGGRLGLVHLRDCGERILWGNLLKNVIGKAESGVDVRSNQNIGCTFNQLQNIRD